MKLACNFLIVYTCLALHANVAISQNRIGNGGDAVVCENKKPFSVVLLDFYENKIEDSLGEEDYKKIVTKKIEILASWSKTLGRSVNNIWLSFDKKVEFRKNIELTDIKDSNHLFLPDQKNCMLRQIAIRKSTASADEALFVISEKYWSQMSNMNKAGLILHEFIYDYFFHLGLQDSTAARKVNALLFSDKPDKTQFWKSINTLKVPLYP